MPVSESSMVANSLRRGAGVLCRRDTTYARAVGRDGRHRGLARLGGMGDDVAWWEVAAKRRIEERQQTRRRNAEAGASPSSSNRFSALDGVYNEELEEEISSLQPPPARKHKKIKKGPLVWIDLEMTGLEPEDHTIIEIACLVTDGNLGVKHIGPNLVIHHSEDVLENMNEWSKEQHAKSGLTERVRQSTTSMEDAETEVLEFMRKHTDSGFPQLAGNTVYTDMMFLRKYMPRVTEHLNYRLVDVSSVKELCKRWYPNDFRKRPRKTMQHTALSDIEESLEELKWYRKKIFKKQK